jgi:hypothetical protein
MVWCAHPFQRIHDNIHSWFTKLFWGCFGNLKSMDLPSSPPSHPQFCAFEIFRFFKEFTLIFSKKHCSQSAKIHPKNLMLDHYTCPIPMTLANWIPFFSSLFGYFRMYQIHSPWMNLDSFPDHIPIYVFATFAYVKYGHSKVIQFIRLE